MKIVSQQHFREYKMRASKRMTSLEERIIRLERKEAESYGNVKMIPELYLAIESIYMKAKNLKCEKEVQHLEELISKKEISPMLPKMISDAINAWNIASEKGDGRSMGEILELIDDLLRMLKSYSSFSQN